MDYQVILHPLPEKEYLEACYWYEGIKPDLGKRFKQSVINQLNHITNNPKAYPVKNRNYRESNIKVFSYTIVYKIDHKNNIIYVSAIYHSSRNPKKSIEDFKYLLKVFKNFWHTTLHIRHFNIRPGLLFNYPRGIIFTM